MQGVKKWIFCSSDNVDKELKYNQYIFISSIHSHASHTKEQCCSGETSIQSLNIHWRQSWWRYCKVSSVQVQPKVTPTGNHHWNGGSITSLSSCFLQSLSSQFQLLQLNLSVSFLSPAMWSPQEGQVESWEGGGPSGGIVQLEVA